MKINEDLSITVALEQTAFAPMLATDDLSKTLLIAADAGFGSVEVLLRHPDDAVAAKLEKGLRESGLALRGVLTGPARTVDGLSLCDPTMADESVARVKTMIEFAADHRAHIVLGWLLGQLPEAGRSRELFYETLKSSLRRCADIANQRDVKLLFEPLNRYETNIATRADVAANIIDSAGGGIELLLDTFHMNIEEGDPPTVAGKFASRTGHVHVADSNRGVPGTGHSPLRQIIESLRESDYSGTMGIEAELGEDMALSASRSYRSLTALLDCNESRATA